MELYTKVCCLLHNYLIDTSELIDDEEDSGDPDDEFVEPDVRNIFVSIAVDESDLPTVMCANSIKNRDLLANYLMYEDVLHWQEDTVNEDGYMSP